jgi:hypothetical protein
MEIDPFVPQRVTRWGGTEGIAMDRYDVNERFARRHLSTPGERAAWLALSGQDSSLSAAQIAETTGLDEAEVQPVLDGFEAAGIVDTSWSTHHITYRWSMNMNYLFGGLAPSGWIDPVLRHARS